MTFKVGDKVRFINKSYGAQTLVIRWVFTEDSTASGCVKFKGIGPNWNTRYIRHLTPLDIIEDRLSV